MTRNRWPVLVGVLGGALWANCCFAQMGPTPTEHTLQTAGASDVQVSTIGPNWASSWGMGLFGLQFHSWGRASARPWSGRTSVAVLRERCGQVR